MDTPTTPGAEGPSEDTLKYGCSHYRRKCKFVVSTDKNLLSTIHL